jgi:AcrR family transcriptional regulator
MFLTVRLFFLLVKSVRCVVVQPMNRRDRWVEAGLSALAASGPDAVKIEALAKALGVTKGGFYWHFADRPAFLGAVLAAWERAAVADVIAEVEGEGGTPHERLWRLFDLARLATTTASGLGAELAVRDWARRDPAVAERLRRVDDSRMAYLRTLFSESGLDPEEAEARSYQVYALFIGGAFITARHGDLTREQVVRRALTRLTEDL